MRSGTIAVMQVLAAIVALVLGSVLTLEVEQASSLKIVVLEGEGAVNIIQQKTAVRPLVEVRDRNNLPVAGVPVTFSIGGGQGAAFAGGVQTLTVTTNAAGQAAASGLNALSSGAFQIQVQAAYQGQIATAAISQTNFATAAAAAQAGATAGGGTTSGTAGGAAGGGGGGISGTTIGIIGAAVGGGALAATQVVAQSSDKDVFDTYSGSLNGQLQLSSFFTPAEGGATSNCVRTFALTGSMKIELKNGGTPGTVGMTMNQTEVAVAGPCQPSTPPPLSLVGVAVSGTAPALTFSNVGQSAGGGSTSGTTTVKFTGSLSGTTITGTVSLDIVQIGSTLSPNAGANGSTSFPVTLQK